MGGVICTGFSEEAFKHLAQSITNATSAMNQLNEAIKDMVTEKTITAKQLQDVLCTKYSAAVKAKQYEYLNYKDWRLFTNLPADTVINLEVMNLNSADDYIRVTWNGISPKLHEERYYVIKPASFGAFLRSEFFLKQPEDDMTTSTDNGYYTTNIINPNPGNVTYATSYDKINWGDYVTSIPATDWQTLTVNNGTWTSTAATLDDVCKKSECPLNKKEKEEKTMVFKNFDFGPCTNENVRMSLYGLAVKNTNGSWVSYNKESKQIIDVDVFNFDGRKFLFKMPVAVAEIQVGDIVIHNRIPMFVTSIEGGIQVVDAVAGDVKTILPATNMFGFNFVTKIVSLLDVYSKAPTPDSPFGNFLPFMLMQDGNVDSNTLLMMSLMNGENTMGLDMSNPMMLYFLLNDNKDGKEGKFNDLLPLLFLGQKK